MEALFDTCKQLVAEITLSCQESEVYAAECLKLAKYVAKCALALTEVELYMREEQSLRGSQSLFLAVDSMVSALKQVQQLVDQFASARGSGVWPLEDAVEFEAAALELRNAMLGLSKSRVQLPIDVQEDLQHFVRQLGELQFTTSELTETEELVESKLQQHTPRAAADAEQPGSPFDRPARNAAARFPGTVRVTSPARKAPSPARQRSEERQQQGGGEEEEGNNSSLAGGLLGLPPVLLGVVEAAAEEEQPPSPLPDDPFNMETRLESSTVEELEGLKLQTQSEGEGLGSLAEESLLEAQEDNRDVMEASLADWALLGVDLESPPPCEPPGSPSAAAAAASPPPAQSAASGPGRGGGGRGGGGGGSEDALAGLRELTEAARNSPQEGEEEEDGDDDSEEVQQMGTLVEGMVATLEEEGEGQEKAGGTSAGAAGKAGAAQAEGGAALPVPSNGSLIPGREQ